MQQLTKKALIMRKVAWIDFFPAVVCTVLSIWRQAFSETITEKLDFLAPQKYSVRAIPNGPDQELLPENRAGG